MEQRYNTNNMASKAAATLPTFSPSFPRDGFAKNTPRHESLISSLHLQPHIEGGYFVETDRDSLRIPNPFALGRKGPSTSTTASTEAQHTPSASSSDMLVQSRNASTTIHYYLSPVSPLGAFHRNKGRTVHTLHKGRGRYVIIHADEVASSTCPGGYGGADDLPESVRWRGKARIETFIVGQDVEKGERLQWIVDGGKYKSSYLQPDVEGGEESAEGLLISETVIPGFEYVDHDFMRIERLEALVEDGQVEGMRWMVRKDDA